MSSLKFELLSRLFFSTTPTTHIHHTTDRNSTQSSWNQSSAITSTLACKVAPEAVPHQPPGLLCALAIVGRLVTARTRVHLRQVAPGSWQSTPRSDVGAGLLLQFLRRYLEQDQRRSCQNERSYGSVHRRYRHACMRYRCWTQ